MLIKIKVFTKEKKNQIIKKKDDNFDVRIKEAPIQGAANKKIKEVLSKYFNVSESKVRILKGFKKRNKIIEIKI